MDISLFKKLASESGSTQIAETGEPVRIEITVPEEMLNRDSSISRQYAIVRNHGGQVDILPAAFNAGTHTLMFETNKFSDYGIIYRDNRIPDNSSSGSDSSETSESTYVGTYYPTQSAGTAATGDNANIVVLFGLLGIETVGLLVIRKRA